ncbi:beta-lactamase family protein [Brevibacillus sp. SYP-B805]|uniref:serine hydrolase domain-containing protein n=1 Tax=Brevibacillus sp. SYP-B805 TaxID=1578199 RepID=UPI0013ED6BF3|nr:serine hydrolase domain-containing protein [Brevibacillus sp. SYP-B805]NGQ94172.1 beta-lactamase family protein [Brevibacillus sp. SYP-B805]
MRLPTQLTDQFDKVVQHVERMGNVLSSSATAVMVIHRDKVVTEHYGGRHGPAADSRPVQADSRFHVASVRKSYLGFAAAYAVLNGDIASIDDPVLAYLPELDPEVAAGTTIRHLLTHTHGLGSDEQGNLCRRFPAGTAWEYRNESIAMLAEIVKRTTGQTVAAILQKQVFAPLQMTETGWQTEAAPELVQLVMGPHEPPVVKLDQSPDGAGMNLYVSTRELAYWGYLHLKKGNMEGRQIVPPSLIETATTIQSPLLEDKDSPQNGYLWFVKDLPAARTELGERVPAGSYQILGYTGATLLVVPDCDLVAVRMYNRWGSSPGYDYLRDVKDFGNLVMDCVMK